MFNIDWTMLMPIRSIIMIIFSWNNSTVLIFFSSQTVCNIFLPMLVNWRECIVTSTSWCVKFACAKTWSTLSIIASIRLDLIFSYVTLFWETKYPFLGSCWQRSWMWVLGSWMAYMAFLFARYCAVAWAMAGKFAQSSIRRTSFERWWNEFL